MASFRADQLAKWAGIYALQLLSEVARNGDGRHNLRLIALFVVIICVAPAWAAERARWFCGVDCRHFKAVVTLLASVRN